MTGLGLERLISIVEDHAMLVTALRIIMEAAETKELPKESAIPLLNDSLVNEDVIKTLELVTGKKYEDR